MKAHPALTEEHEAFRDTMRRFVAKEIAPHATVWDEAVQTLGGAGFIRGTRAERIYREVKVMTIGGGAEEIMKDLAARQLGWQ